MADQDRFARALLALARGLGRIARERARAGDVTPQQAETLQLIAERGALPLVGERVRIALPADPADLVLDKPIRRMLDVDILEVDRHVPSEVRVSLLEIAAETDNEVER